MGFRLERKQPLSEFGEYMVTVFEQSNFDTVRDLCRRIGVSESMMNNWIIGKARPTIKWCEKIAITFGVPIGEVRMAAGQPIPISIDSVIPKDIRSRILGMRWTDEKMNELRFFLESIDEDSIHE